MTPAEQDALVPSIKQAVAGRLRLDDPGAVAVEIERSADIAGLALFSAWSTAGRGRDFVNGLARADGSVETDARRAIEEVLAAWEAGGDPGPRSKAEVVAFLLTGAGMAEVVDDSHPPSHEPGPVVAGKLAPPLETSGGLLFWIDGREGLARVEVTRGEKGVDCEVVQGFEFEEGTYDPAGFDGDI